MEGSLWFIGGHLFGSSHSLFPLYLCVTIFLLIRSPALSVMLHASNLSIWRLRYHCHMSKDCQGHIVRSCLKKLHLTKSTNHPMNQPNEIHLQTDKSHVPLNTGGLNVTSPLEPSCCTTVVYTCWESGDETLVLFLLGRDLSAAAWHCHFGLKYHHRQHSKAALKEN